MSSMRALSSIRTYQRHGVHAQEQFRAILAGDRDEAAELLDRWCSRAQRSRLEPFVKVAKTMRERRNRGKDRGH